LRRIPRFIRNTAVQLLRLLPTADTGRRTDLLRLARNIEDARLPAAERYIVKQHIAFRRECLARISRLAVAKTGAALDRETYALLFDDTREYLGRMALCQQTLGLPDDMLVKVDRMSMAHSLEVRAPFLDHRLAELMNAVPFSIKMPGGRQKYILRKALEPYFPADFLWRRKQGFTVPLTYWFKDDLHTYIRQKLLAPDAVVCGLFPREELERLIGEHLRLSHDRSIALWTLLMFETWCRRFGIRAEQVVA